MSRKFLIVILLTLVSRIGFSQMIKIGLYNDQVVHSIVVYCTNGEYLVKSEQSVITEMKKGEILFAVLEEGKIHLHNASQQFGEFSSIELESLVLEGIFRIRPVIPALESRSYDDDLILDSKNDFINIINRVDFDKYIAGVLESEIGPNAEPEVYKAHSLLSRTYALKGFEKHREEGFSLCDGVHCQVYNGRNVYNPEISKAVFETSGEIIADFHYRLITAAYHSNSGGETQRSSDVWLNAEDYLQAVMDPHSLHQPHAKWYDTIYYADWKKYLLDNGMNSVKKLPEELLYVQQLHRKKYFILDRDTIRFTKIREDWNLKSTYFNMFPEDGGKIVIWGKGYGHGIGLSQEGAMKMARNEYNYRDIIQFYYYNVRLMNFEDLPNSSLPDMDF